MLFFYIPLVHIGSSYSATHLFGRLLHTLLASPDYESSVGVVVTKLIEYSEDSSSIVSQYASGKYTIGYQFYEFLFKLNF